MARRYGSSSSSSSCFDSSYGLYDSYELAQYACVVIFLAVYLGTLIAVCVVRRRTGSGKHLIGLPYMFALFFMFIQQALNFLSYTLRACDEMNDMESLYDWNIASLVFYGLETFLFLFVVIYTLNIMLRKQLGHNPSALKIAFGLDLFVLGGLLLSYVVLLCYTYWRAGRFYRTRLSGFSFNYIASTYVCLAFDAVYMISILASGVLSLLAARSLKKKHVASGSLMVWISVLILSLFVYTLLSIIQISSQLSYGLYFGEASYTVMYWITSFCRGLAFITIIFIARNPVWRPNTFAATGPIEQQYAYNYQQEPPIYAAAGQRA
ncbi:hypothetical protein BU25DRAFT_412980 [Macroventuria anomochaeta]|uniref:Uncharacterized protein n=1 Tax=Macroventuria anomochaeta TaxID=301207 RepID=A0ACB6RW69_9PLEO|nr:uncharacterized protein BU25DRAFT_412980 [Macroventuria anomochaeta]KAF2625179.1 hypothetical protein BU25DRAFT_412980 [Macroventuria anomochaeta]